MELKQGWPENKRWQKGLLIRPEWNWNQLKWRLLAAVPWRLLIRPEWNWNKDCWGSQVRPFLKLLIRPEWNWNKNRESVFTKRCDLLIRPEWNWNILSIAFSLCSLKLLIRPEWNWNWIKVFVMFVFFNAFNQTRMELKLGRLAPTDCTTRRF